MGTDKLPSGKTVRGPATERHFVRELDSAGVKPLVVLSSGRVSMAVSTMDELRTVLRVAGDYDCSVEFGGVNGSSVYDRTNDVDVDVVFD